MTLLTDRLTYILFDYGIDDIRSNLQFLKDHSTNNMYCIEEVKLSNSIEESIRIVEESQLEEDLREAVIDLWETIESKFETQRKNKRRQ